MGGGEGEDGWRYTWEAQSHVPTLRLMLFPNDKTLNPSLQCHDLAVNLHSSHSFLTLTTSSLSLRVPLPAVLVDADSPVTFRPLSDHIEVKLLLLLPVDHPILSSLHPSTSPLPDPLISESDVSKLSSAGEVDFYCRTCTFKLTRIPLRNFVEMPSVNWREVADNWFGACCCSFGGISEKMVMRYVSSYTCVPGVCLLSSASVTLCKDDLVEYNFPEGCGKQECTSVAENPRDDAIGKVSRNCELNDERTSTCSDDERTSTCSDDGGVTLAFGSNYRFVDSEDEKLSMNLRCEVAKSKPDCGHFSDSHPDSNGTKDVSETPSCCARMTNNLGDEHSEHHSCGTAGREGMPTETLEILGNQKSLIGAYPCCEGHTPVDEGVRLFKCYISTCLPVGGPEDMFSKYSMGKMFANRLVECASDESLFRFVIRDLTTKAPVLQIILLNPDTWSCSGNCSGTEDKDPVHKLKLQPIIKVLYSDCHNATESQSRIIEEWATKSSAESIFMMTRQSQELVGLFISAKDLYPPSCASFQGLILSSLQW
ncbi:uncharacterized protein [Phaseolus vulgaris]|uniref:uncharacterized protein isoform X2 n=1 Tax=Phaseolus vulgaris TaxID=3885 RepID=UPI0035C96276